MTVLTDRVDRLPPAQATGLTALCHGHGGLPHRRKFWLKKQLPDDLDHFRARTPLDARPFGRTRDTGDHPPWSWPPGRCRATDLTRLLNTVRTRLPVATWAVWVWVAHHLDHPMSRPTILLLRALAVRRVTGVVGPLRDAKDTVGTSVNDTSLTADLGVDLVGTDGDRLRHARASGPDLPDDRPHLLLDHLDLRRASHLFLRDRADALVRRAHP